MTIVLQMIAFGRVGRKGVPGASARLRPVQIWVPDTRSEAFRANARRQAQAVARSSHEAEDQAFIDAVSEHGDE